MKFVCTSVLHPLTLTARGSTLDVRFQAKERANKDIYDDFKLKKTPLVSIKYSNIFQQFKS